MLLRLKTDNKFETYRDNKTKLHSLVEIYSMCEPKMNCRRKHIDVDFVQKELQKLNIAEVEQTLRSLAMKLLSVKKQEPLTTQEAEMLEL